MGTLHGVKLPPESRDRRVQMTMLLLRSIQGIIYPDDDAPLHVVGENAIDSSAALALGPSSAQGLPDFVNTQVRRRMKNELNFPPNFEGLVLGCTDADFCK